MCGIAGVWSTSGVNPELIQSMTRTLSHRGPDAEGYWNDAHCALGHRRLKILDLSDSANQPMVSADGNWVMVYNGEVYNFKQLAKKYLSNHPLRTSSDTEVILECFAKVGPDIVNHFNGIFSIGLYHTRDNKLYLIRDKFGIKPLMYASWDGGIAFASEIKALLKLDAVDLSINNLAIEQFLQLGYIPAPLTIFNQIKKLEPGSILVFEKNSFSLKRHSEQLNEKSVAHDQKYRDLKEAKAHLLEALKNSVENQMVADVPVGVFLSSGIDSTCLSVMASQRRLGTLKTFSIGTGKYQESELPLAKKTAKFIGSDHYEYLIQPSEVEKELMDCINFYDEPYADTSAVPTLLVSKLAREHVTVALSGDGADETFLGYGAYQWARRRNNPLLFLAGQFISNSAIKVEKGRLHKLARMMEISHTLDQVHTFSVEHGFFSLEETRELLNDQNNSFYSFPSFMPLFENEEENQALFDRCYYLPDDLLKKVDRASMYYGLEVRVPFLDHEVQKVAAHIPLELKVKGEQRKFILREILKDCYRDYDFSRPKRGFSIPMNLWLSNDLYYLVEEWLSPSQVRSANVVKQKAVDTLVNRFKNGASQLYAKIWLLIVLHQFLHRYRSR